MRHRTHGSTRKPMMIPLDLSSIGERVVGSAELVRWGGAGFAHSVAVLAGGN